MQRAFFFAVFAVISSSAVFAVSASAPQPPPPPPNGTAATFTIFLRAQPIGTEQVTLTHGTDGWSIVSSGRTGAPVDVVGRRVEVRYTDDWHPLEMTIDATIRGQPQTLHTVVQDRTAKTTFTSENE